MEAKEQVFKGRTAAEARAKMHRALGNDPDRIELVRTRQVREGGFLGLGGSVLWEIVARPAAPRAPGRGAARGRAARRPSHFLQRTYAEGAGLPRPEGAADPGAARPPAEVAALSAEVSAMRTQMEEVCRRLSARGRPDVCPELLDFYVQLVENEVAEGLAKSLVERVQRDLAGSASGGDHEAVQRHLMGLISEVIATSGPIRLRSGRATTVALIGPTGVGKTTSVAKLAARFALLEGKRVALVTSDTYRIAAVDQLYRYGELMRLPVREVSSPAKVRGVLDELSDMDLVLLDTAGRSQRDDSKMNDLRLFLDAARPDETHLVLSGTSSYGHLAAAIERFSRFDVDHVLFTKLDEAASCGLLLNVLLRLKKSLSYVTTGQGVPDDIEVGDAKKLARLIVGGNPVGARVEYAREGVA